MCILDLVLQAIEMLEFQRQFWRRKLHNLLTTRHEENQKIKAVMAETLLISPV